MKRRILSLLFVVFMSVQCFAQSHSGFDCLGVWYTVLVDFTQPTQNELVFTIPVHPEGIYLDTPNGLGNTRGPVIQGPGRPRLWNYLGNTVDLYLNKKELLIISETSNECTLDLFVNRTVDAWGTPNLGNMTQCYYYIRVSFVR